MLPLKSRQISKNGKVIGANHVEFLSTITYWCFLSYLTHPSFILFIISPYYFLSFFFFFTIRHLLMLLQCHVHFRRTIFPFSYLFPSFWCLPLMYVLSFFLLTNTFIFLIYVYIYAYMCAFRLILC